jgi:two-component system KDP operon response regulator KdpE
MKADILVIDDEIQIRRFLKIALKSEGYGVIEADTGETGLAAAVRHQPDLIVLDLGLPDLEGHEVLKRLREWSKIPVIVLSVRNNENEKVTALDEGAQDYVTKPFSIEEFLARVRTNLRGRLQKTEFPILDDGNLRIDFPRREVLLKGKKIKLTPKEYAVLFNLSSNPDRVITQTHLLREIWGPSHLHQTHYLRNVISHIRQKIGDDPTEPHYLITEPGIGYRFLFKNTSQ